MVIRERSLPVTLREVLSPETEITVISRPHFDSQAFTDFLEGESLSWRHDADATEAELLTEASGRICYMSFGDAQHTLSTDEYIRKLIAQGHESVLEHASWTLLMTGVSRAFTHQLVRHRAGFSFSQLSQQYHDEQQATFVPPKEIVDNPKLLEPWAEEMLRCKRAYETLVEDLERGKREIYPRGMSDRELKRAARSAARSVLPNCTATKIVVTANARAIRHFLSVRGQAAGDYEMLDVSQKLLRLMQAEAPALFSDFHFNSDGPSPIIKRVRF